MPTTNDDRWDSSRHDCEPAPNSTGNHELILPGDSETNARYRTPTSTMNMEGLVRENRAGRYRSVGFRRAAE